MITNSFIRAKEITQHLSWKHLKDKTEYHFELILPFNSIVQDRGRRRGVYMCICAEVITDNELSSSNIIKGQMIIIELPVQTFDRIWRGVNYIFRSQLTERDNLRLKIKKNSYKEFYILEYERLQPSPEHIQFAEREYPKLFNANNTNIREMEEL